MAESDTLTQESETEITCAIDFYDKKTFNRVLSKKMLAFLKLRQQDINRNKKYDIKKIKFLMLNKLIGAKYIKYIY
jgi:hypothetical protein